MRACRRGEAPALLTEHGQRIGVEYAARRQVDPAHSYRWRTDLYVAARSALGLMTQERCSYCDGYPLGDTGEEHIDHFKPKSRSEFYELVCVWDNLFFVCSACNKAKRDEWHEDLLRPDADGFAFERFFEYRDDTGEILPHPDGSPDDRRCAQRTIEILDLNRTGKRIRRKETAQLIRAALREGPAAANALAQDIGHRFLIPFCM